MRITVALLALYALTVLGGLASVAFGPLSPREAVSVFSVVLAPLSGLLGFAVACTMTRH